MQVIFRSKEHRQDCWEIVIDGEKWREVHRAIFGKKPRFPSLSSETDLQALFDDFEYRRVKGYVLWRLSQQSYHSEQLIYLLSKRLVQPQTIDRVIMEYQNMGLLDDESWLKNFIKSQQKRYSLRLILSKLRSKGLSSKSLEHVAAEWANPDEELDAIQHLLRTRYRSRDLSQYKNKQKVIQALLRKGYPLEQIYLALEIANN